MTLRLSVDRASADTTTSVPSLRDVNRVKGYSVVGSAMRTAILRALRSKPGTARAHDHVDVAVGGRL